jgi:hypothetical protein
VQPASVGDGTTVRCVSRRCIAEKCRAFSFEFETATVSRHAGFIQKQKTALHPGRTSFWGGHSRANFYFGL